MTESMRNIDMDLAEAQGTAITGTYIKQRDAALQAEVDLAAQIAVLKLRFTRAMNRTKELEAELVEARKKLETYEPPLEAANDKKAEGRLDAAE